MTETTTRTVIIDGIKLPAPAWFKLATAAESRNRTVAEVIAQIVEDSFRPATKPDTSPPIERRKMTARRAQQFLDLYEHWHSDMDIGERIGVSGETVRRYRRSLNLPTQAERMHKEDAE